MFLIEYPHRLDNASLLLSIHCMRMVVVLANRRIERLLLFFFVFDHLVLEIHVSAKGFGYCCEFLH